MFTKIINSNYDLSKNLSSRLFIFVCCIYFRCYSIQDGEIELCLCRHTGEPYPDHGKADAGPVRAVPSGRVQGRTGRGDQQEAVERDHQGTQPALLYHQRSLHPPHPVSLYTRPSATDVAWSVCLSVCLSTLRTQSVYTRGLVLQM